MSTTKLTLGQPVTITDYLVRANVTAKQVLILADRWAELPPVFVDKAQKSIDRNRDRTYHWDPTFRMWIPASIVSTSWSDGVLGYIITEKRNHPSPHYSEVGLPLPGVVTQKIQVQDGSVNYCYEEGNIFTPFSVRTGYWVAYHLSRRPLLVLPSMIEEPTP